MSGNRLIPPAREAGKTSLYPIARLAARGPEGHRDLVRQLSRFPSRAHETEKIQLGASLGAEQPERCERLSLVPASSRRTCAPSSRSF